MPCHDSKEWVDERELERYERGGEGDREVRLETGPAGGASWLTLRCLGKRAV